jgi:hypothetical protein
LPPFFCFNPHFSERSSRKVQQKNQQQKKKREIIKATKYWSTSGTEDASLNFQTSKKGKRYFGERSNAAFIHLHTYYVMCLSCGFYCFVILRRANYFKKRKKHQKVVFKKQEKFKSDLKFGFEFPPGVHKH